MVFALSVVDDATAADYLAGRRDRYQPTQQQQRRGNEMMDVSCAQSKVSLDLRKYFMMW